jgi:hypothetical protein
MLTYNISVTYARGVIDPFVWRADSAIEAIKTFKQCIDEGKVFSDDKGEIAFSLSPDYLGIVATLAQKS